VVLQLVKRSQAWTSMVWNWNYSVLKMMLPSSNSVKWRIHTQTTYGCNSTMVFQKDIILQTNFGLAWSFTVSSHLLVVPAVLSSLSAQLQSVQITISQGWDYKPNGSSTERKTSATFVTTSLLSPMEPWLAQVKPLKYHPGALSDSSLPREEQSGVKTTTLLTKKVMTITADSNKLTKIHQWWQKPPYCEIPITRSDSKAANSAKP
jgi:hypothetical protein